MVGLENSLVENHSGHLLLVRRYGRHSRVVIVLGTLYIVKLIIEARPLRYNSILLLFSSLNLSLQERRVDSLIERSINRCGRCGAVSALEPSRIAMREVMFRNNQLSA